MRYILISFFFFSITLQSYAQYNEVIRTARPGASVGPFTTGKYVFQIQSGVSNTTTNLGADAEIESIRQFNSLRYGILENVEIRSAFAFNADELTLGDVTSKRSGISLWNVGIRYNITNNAGTRKPSLAFQSDFTLTTVSEDYKQTNMAPRMLLIYGQSLNDWLSLTSNWGIRWSGNDGTAIGIYTVNFSFPIAGKWSSFIEGYGTIDNGEFTVNYDTGIGYLVNNNLKLDISGGYGDNNGVETFFLDGGVSWRVKVK